MRVESRIGRSESAALTRSEISEQDSVTASQPPFLRSRICIGSIKQNKDLMRPKRQIWCKSALVLVDGYQRRPAITRAVSSFAPVLALIARPPRGFQSQFLSAGLRLPRLS
jgi:hypothetical protein